MKKLTYASISTATLALLTLLTMALCGVDMKQFTLGFIEGLTGIDIDWLLSTGIVEFWIMYVIIYM